MAAAMPDLPAHVRRANMLIVIDADGYLPRTTSASPISGRHLATPETDGYRLREIGLAVWHANAVRTFTYFVYDVGVRALTGPETNYVFRRLHGLPRNPTKNSYVAFKNSRVCGSHEIIGILAQTLAALCAEPPAGSACVFVKGGHDAVWFGPAIPCPVFDLNDMHCPTATVLAQTRNGNIPVCANHSITQNHGMHCPSAEVLYLLDWLVSALRRTRT